MGGGKVEKKVVLLGLDSAGKTSIMDKLKRGELTWGIPGVPTNGYNVEMVPYKKFSFAIWDVGGRSVFRPLWRDYFSNVHAVILVVDSSDQDRTSDQGGGTWDSAESIVRNLLCENELKDAPLLVFANKQDLPNAMPPRELTDKLGLLKIRNREWFIQGTSATTGAGLDDGLGFLAYVLSKKEPQSWLRNPFVRNPSKERWQKELYLMQLWQRISPIILFVWANKESALHSSAFSLSRAICDFLSLGIASDLLLSQEEVQRIVQLFTKTAFFENVTGIKAAKKKDPSSPASPSSPSPSS